jgi:dipeptidyl aminopeptidase/acylaminoacyl peptidase
VSEPIQRDLRATALYKEVETLYNTLRQPGTGQLSDATEVHVSYDGKHVTFAGAILDKLEGMPPTRICEVEVASGETRVLTFGPNTDRSPKYSPDGKRIAFLSDRHKTGDFQLYLLDPRSGAARPTSMVEGWVEYLRWSPDGQLILLGVAGHGADVSGGQGAISSKQASEALPSWIPAVGTGDETYRWRRAWVYELANNTIRQVSKASNNIWEATWCGNDALAVIVSPGPGEGLWYSARLAVIDLKTGNSREVFTPEYQLGWPAASPSGKRLAIVEALCSDRGFVAGDLRLIDTTSGNVQQINTDNVDITYTEWRSEQKLLLAGHRGFETVVGLCDAGSGTFTEIWKSNEFTAAGAFYAAVSGFDESGDCVLASRGFQRAPEVGVLRKGKYKVVRSFDIGYVEQIKVLQAVDRYTWKAKDGLEIQGWLLMPRVEGPCPVVMSVHGGPVGHSRPQWLSPLFLMLLRRGYAVFMPNPRGSSGRGQAFVRHVYGDMGGADAQDLLSGLDALVERGVVDPKRIGVIGVSYGGFMASWLITQDMRFAAAVAVAPHTNQVTEHLIGNLPHFMTMITKDTWNNPGGMYFDRSPIMHAHKARTPTLNIAGALDKCTPPEEAVQFHNALLENNVQSTLTIYPEEGHGVRQFPAVIDYTARVIGWFERFMPSQNRASESI